MLRIETQGFWVRSKNATSPQRETHVNHDSTIFLITQSFLYVGEMTIKLAGSYDGVVAQVVQQWTN